MQFLVVAVIVVAVFAVIHFHLLPAIEAKVSALLHKHAAAAPVAQIVQTQIPPPSHSATPPANSGSTGSLVGQPVPGGDTPDSNGAIAIPGIAAKFAPGSRFLTVASLPYIATGSAAAYCVATNCASSDATAQITGLQSTVARAVVNNPASAVAVGWPAFHLSGMGLHEIPPVTIPNVITLSAKFATVADIVAFYANKPDYGTQGSGSGFSPIQH